MNVLSLFDGMSCGQIAFEKVGIEVNNYFASEIKEDGIKITTHNYPQTNHLGSILNIDGKDFKDIDILIGGSPCQNLSIAMAKEHRKGLNGDKSGLFYEYYRVLNEVSPTYFLLENVGGMDKKDRAIITELLGVEPIQINSSLVSAQLRNRLYWTNIPNVKQPKDKKIMLNDILTYGWSDRKKARCVLESESRPLTTPIKMFHRYFSTGFTTLIFKSESHYLKCAEHYKENFHGMSAKEIDKILQKIDCSIYDGVRYLNQKELETLQTVPIGYTNILNRNVAAGLLGDGWTIDIIAHILKNVK